MPYISPENRADVDEDGPANAGELTYALTRLVLNYLGPNPKFQAFNAAIGSLECTKLELYRRKIAPYEDKKIAENGDIYT